MYIKAFIVGIVGALLFAAVWVWAPLLLPISSQTWEHRGDVGFAVSYVEVGGASTLFVALIGFALGSWWSLRRARKQLMSPNRPA